MQFHKLKKPVVQSERDSNSSDSDSGSTGKSLSNNWLCLFRAGAEIERGDNSGDELFFFRDFLDISKMNVNAFANCNARIAQKGKTKCKREILLNIIQSHEFSGLLTFQI